MPVRARPLSPHLEVYRWRLNMVLSITHRITGIALSVGFLVLMYWLVAVAGGPRAYESAAAVLASPLGILALILWTFAFFYHCLAGVRHLMFDVGFGFERAQRRRSGLITIAGAVVLTFAVWILLWHGAHS
jgi:succinate dehydrogenase / fumarate reductase cytochrome b subunit